MLTMAIVGFLPGMILGASLGSPPPPSASWDERCQSAPDTIACLIVMLD